MSQATKAGATGEAGIEGVRVYEDPGRRPGEHRVLVDRLWPRGIRKITLDFDEWAKDAAPSADLRRWYGHDPERFGAFARRYKAELDHEPAASAVERLRTLVGARGRVVLLTATRDVEHSGAAVLADVLAAGRSR